MAAYTRTEGGIWTKFPEQYGTISVRCFLDHVELKAPGEGEFHYGGVPLLFHSVKFSIPFVKQAFSGTKIDDRNIFDVGIWTDTNYQTGWRDEYDDWRKS